MGVAIKVIFMIAIITMALTITLTMKLQHFSYNNNVDDNTNASGTKISSSSTSSSVMENLDGEIIKMPILLNKRRFLAQDVPNPNPRAADHCKKDNEICTQQFGTNSTCCNNKCMDLSYDSNNCGACKTKCLYTETCCRGECVNVAYDKRHCGKCDNRCMPGGFCIYGLCDYA